MSEEEQQETEAVEETTEQPTFTFPPLFGKYLFSEVTVNDPGLVRYINLQPIYAPHNSGKFATRPFAKTKVNIVERLINGMMRTEHITGQKARMITVVKDASEIIERRVKENPIQVLVKAVENSSPREEITRLQFGGISVPKAVDVSSSRRVDIALRNLCKGTLKNSHKNKKRLQMCLAEELISASQNNMNSFAVSKKEELERVASSAR